MDLPELLEPERIRCHCDIHSKKRALQTVAELLGQSLRAVGERASADPSAPDESATEAEKGARVPEGRASRIGVRKRSNGSGRSARRASRESDDEPSAVSDMAILDALITRERLGSTGLGHGVALPHSRLGLIDAPLAAMITLNDGVDFESVDGEPVDLVLGLLVPQDCNDEHLRILANLARRFSDAELREALRGYDSGEELFAHLQRLAAE